MFDGWTQWTWVIVAWLQLVFVYGGYLAYLSWRRRKLSGRAAQPPSGRDERGLS